MTNTKEIMPSAMLQWQVGDWKKLTLIGLDDLAEEPNREKLALMVATSWFQLGDSSKAKQALDWALASGASSELVRQFMIAGVYNTLGRARAIVNDLEKAREHFKSAIKLGVPETDQQLAAQVRMAEQLAQLGIPQTWRRVEQAFPFNTEQIVHVLENLKRSLPDQPGLLIALAETVHQNHEYDQAVRYWQELAGVLEEEMPQVYYDRLDQAYLKLAGFPLGGVEEELRGKGDKHELLAILHKVLQPDFYLEIGVQTGKSLNIADCTALGIDPMPRSNIKLKPHAKVLRMTSDEFFANHAEDMLHPSPDLVFIDGMHLFEYALRDFMNVEKYSSSSTLVVIDDIFPGHPVQAERERKTRAWTGDVWKFLAILQEYRQDLEILTIDIYPTGLLVVKNLDSANRVLEENYDEIVKEFMKKQMDIEQYVGRKGAINVDQFLERLENEEFKK